MTFAETMMASVDRRYSSSCRQEVENAMGVGYGTGMEVGHRLLWVLERHDQINLRQPIFATEPQFDRGESAGFKAQLGVAPELPLEEVATVIKDRFGIDTHFEEVVTEEQLKPTERIFMTGRLPAVRVCPVYSITEAAVA